MFIIEHFKCRVIYNNEGLIGTTAAIITGAVIAGGAAIGATAIASSGAKKAAKTQADAQRAQIAAQQQAAAKEEATRQEAVERKETAVRDIKFPTFLEGEAAQQLRGTLEERIAGRGLLDIDKLTAPFAAQTREGVSRSITASGSVLSAAGLGRSSLRGAQAGALSQAGERDIEQRVAGLQIENQKLIESNIDRFQNLVGREASSQERKALFERGGEFNIAETIAGNAVSSRQNEFAIAESIEREGATAAANQLLQSQIFAAGLIGIGKGATQATDDIVSAIENKQRNDILAAAVNRGQGIGQPNPLNFPGSSVTI